MAEPEKLHDEDEGSHPHPATAWEEGVYRWVKKLWGDDEVGMLFFLHEGARRVVPWGHRKHNLIFDWSSDFIEEGYVERVPGSEELGEMIRERDLLTAKIRALKAKILEEDD